VRWAEKRNGILKEDRDTGRQEGKEKEKEAGK